MSNESAMKMHAVVVHAIENIIGEMMPEATVSFLVTDGRGPLAETSLYRQFVNGFHVQCQMLTLCEEAVAAAKHNGDEENAERFEKLLGFMKELFDNTKEQVEVKLN